MRTGLVGFVRLRRTPPTLADSTHPTSGFPLPRMREDRPRFHEERFRENDTGSRKRAQEFVPARVPGVSLSPAVLSLRGVKRRGNLGVVGREPMSERLPRLPPAWLG